MKTKVVIISSLFIAIILGGCENLIDLKPISTISSSSFWEDENDVRSATFGMYNQFRSTFDVKAILWGEFRTGHYGQGSSTATDWNELWENNLFPTTQGTNWSDLYLLINDANLIISKTIDISFNEELEKDDIIGQAYFVRAFTYFQIVKLWGDAPIVTEGFESTDQDLLPKRSPKSELFIQIKNDIEKAIELLKESKSVNYIGKTAAYMLKTDVYLWTAKLENGGRDDLLEAQKAVDEVLRANYSLESVFESVFRNENSSEIIFSIFYSELEPGTGGRNGSSGRSQTGTHPANIVLPSVELTPPALRGIAPVIPASQWLNLSEYFIDNILKPTNVDSRTDVTWLRATSGNNSVSWINKYLGEVVSETRIPTSDLIIYRLAETILFKSEIENALDNREGALEYLNIIAKRAYGKDNYYTVMDKDEIDNAILEERILEFVLEGKSWYDILRFGQAFQRIPSLFGQEGAKEGNILLFPVAQDVLNRNMNILQTEGY